MYNLSFATLVNDLLPHFHRKEKMKAWLEVLLSPINNLYGLWLDQFSIIRFFARITGQTVYLEYMLNILFLTGTDIYIADDPSETNDVFIFNKSENEEETFIFNASETGEDDTFLFNSDELSQVDFIVMVPVSLTFDYDYMYSLVAKYKLAGTTFKIQTY